MPFFDCGYYMQQEYIKPFVMRPREGDYCSIALELDAGVWWLNLPRQIRRTIPMPNSAYRFFRCYFPQR
jgi:hypothetical protein